MKVISNKWNIKTYLANSQTLSIYITIIHEIGLHFPKTQTLLAQNTSDLAIEIGGRFFTSHFFMLYTTPLFRQ